MPDGMHTTPTKGPRTMRRSLLPGLLLALWLMPPGAGAASLLIENVTVLDGSGAPAIEGASVLVEGERIARVHRGTIGASVTQRIDGAGGFLVPGLMDVHVHLAGGTRVDKEGLRKAAVDNARGILALHSYLYSGVTTIYDAGNNPEFIFGLRERERAGRLVSPRILATGGIVTYPGSHGAFEGATLVDSWPQAIPSLDAHLARGPDLVKFTYEERGWGMRPMIPRLPRPLLRHLVEYYNDHGVRSTVHVSGELRAREAIYAGVDTLAHPVIQGPVSEAFVRLMAARGTPMASTLTIGENYSRLAEHPEFLDEPLYAATVDATERRQLLEVERPRYAADQWTWWMKLMTPVAQENLRRIVAAGGIVALGTDQSSGPAVHRELELLVAGGIPPVDALRIATLNAARFLGRETTLGSIHEGKIADLVLVEADPREDIRNLRRIVQVVKAGQLVDRAALQLPVNAKARERSP